MCAELPCCLCSLFGTVFIFTNGWKNHLIFCLIFGSQVSFPEYKPVNYTHQSVLDMPHWADKDLLSISKKERPVLLFNQEDPVCQYNRVSYMGTYEVQDGLPL